MQAHTRTVTPTVCVVLCSTLIDERINDPLPPKSHTPVSALVCKLYKVTMRGLLRMCSRNARDVDELGIGFMTGHSLLRAYAFVGYRV
jgi:hypothetical protein